jgi:hypothetical protein
MEQRLRYGEPIKGTITAHNADFRKRIAWPLVTESGGTSFGSPSYLLDRGSDFR